MERRIQKHSTRLSAALDAEFRVGARVRTLDGAIGRVILVTESFSPGNTEYQVILDSGQGGGTYLASQLRPVGEGYGGGHQAPAYLPAGVTAALEAEAELEHTAADDYPEMGSILSDRPDPGRQITMTAHYKADDPYEREDPQSHNHGWCHVCRQHHESEQEAEEHDSASTNWRQVYKDLPSRMYRGLAMKLPTGLHEHVHDPDTPPAARAAMLEEHLRHYWSPLGMHWTPTQGQAEHYAEVSSYHGYKSSYSERDPGITHVVVHAAKPRLRDIEKDPDILSGEGVIGHEYHEDAEIPVQGGAPVRVTGLSWKQDNHPDWTHHQFRAHHEHLAATYADGVDPREQDYNGAPEVGGVFWGAPAQQQFVDDELGQPVPGPVEMVGPVEPGEEDEEEPGGEMAAEAAMHVPDWMQRGIMSDPNMSAEDHEFLTHVFDHIRRGAPASEPIDAEDAMTMARGHRTRDRMEDAGFELHPEARTTRYPRGFNLLHPPPGADSSHDLTHTITLSPNHPKGWHVRVSIRNHPMGATHIHHDLDVMDDELPRELHKYLNHPQIAPQLAEQRAQAAFSREAATINGQPVDSSGDAPEHGSIPRAADPEGYDERSTETEGDPRWTEPVDAAERKAFNGAALGMYPEGIDPGGGPGISVAAASAEEDSRWYSAYHNAAERLYGKTGGDTLSEEEDEHCQREADEEIRAEGSLRDDKSDRWHEYNQQYRPATVHRGIVTELPDYLHSYVHDEDQPREKRASALAQHFADQGGLGRHWTPHTQIAHRAIWNAADIGHGYESWEDQSGPRTDVMFHVKRPGRRNETRDPRQLEEHEVGWGYSRGEDETFLKHDSPLQLEGISWKEHEPEYPNEPFEHVDFPRPMRHTARVPWTGHQRELLHSWQEHPTATEGDFVPSGQFTNKYPEPVPEPDPESEFAEAVGPRAFTQMTAAHPAHDPAAESVYQQLARDYPPGAVNWVHDARWEGPHYVPLDQVDFSGRDGWEASGDEKGIAKHRKKIEKREGNGEKPKPAVLVQRPSIPAQLVADGHHRALAEEGLGKDSEEPRKGLWAWTGHVEDDEGPWDHMHDTQGEDQYFPPPDDSLEDGELSATQPQPPVQPMVQRGLPPMSQGGKPGPRTTNQTPVEQSPALQLAHPELQQQQEPPPGEEGDEGEDEDPGTDKALDSFEKAAGSAAFRFEFTSAWHDVVAKAERIVRENGVRITALAGSLTVGEVKGDHATYETGLQYYPGRGFSVMAYSCGCPWATFWQNPDQPGRFAGRMCSHAYALSLAARQRGVVRRTMFPDTSGWPETVVVKSEPPWHPSDKSWAQEWRAPMTSRPVLSSLIADTLDHQAQMPVPAVTAARVLISAGENPAAVTTLLRLAGLSVVDEGSPGGAPLGASGIGAAYLGKAGRLVVLSDQANAPWGSQDVADMPPAKPYGATEQPKKDMDPGSYGFLAGPDPDNWGEIQDGGAIQAPLTNEAARRSEDPNVLDSPDTLDWADDPGQSLAYQDPGARIIDNPTGAQASRYREARQGTGPVLDTEASGAGMSPQAMDTNTGPVSGEWGESFPYADRAGAGGPSTSLTARDPQGIRMEEARDASGSGRPDDEEHPAQMVDPVTDETGDAQDVPHAFSDKGDHTCTRCGLSPSATVHSRAQGQHDLAGQGVRASIGEPQLDGALAELKDEPEGALDDEGLTADVINDAPLLQRRGLADPSQTPPVGSSAQYPDQFTTQNPGMGSLDEPSVPADSSIQTQGQQQFSGADYNSGDLASPQQPGAEEHDVEDDDVGGIVAAFQRSAAARQYTGDGTAVPDGDIAAAARQYLAKTADVLPAEEADELIREGRGTRARNLDLLDLAGTHYTEDPALDEHDDDVLYA